MQLQNREVRDHVPCISIHYVYQKEGHINPTEMERQMF